MPTSRVTDILRAKHTAFLIAALITSLAMESRAAEGARPKPNRAFNDYAGVVSKEAAYRFNQELAQFERETSDQVVVAGFRKMQSDSGIANYTQPVAQAGRVSQNDRRGEHQGTGVTLNPNPNDNAPNAQPQRQSQAQPQRQSQAQPQRQPKPQPQRQPKPQPRPAEPLVLHRSCDCHNCYFDCWFEDPPATQILREEWQKISELLSSSYSD